MEPRVRSRQPIASTIAPASMSMSPRSGAHGLDMRAAVHFQHHRVQQHFDAAAVQLVDEALGILRAGQLLAEAVQAEAVVYALLEDAAQLAIPFQNDDLPRARRTAPQAPPQAPPGRRR